MFYADIRSKQPPRPSLRPYFVTAVYSLVSYTPTSHLYTSSGTIIQRTQRHWPTLKKYLFLPETYFSLSPYEKLLHFYTVPPYVCSQIR